MGRGVTAVATVWIGGVTIRLDLIGRRAVKASRALIELHVYCQCQISKGR